MAEKHREQVCPLGNVHRRMEDAHRLWHQALDSYFDPDSFRVALQSCIQQLRSVTWLLQNQKHAIPDFGVWYGGWQERMRADDVMRWLVEARNQIEKRGDLESYSSVRAQVIASYLNEDPVLEIKSSLFETLEALFSRIPNEVIEKHILEHGTLKVERRWVADDLPDNELLDALGHVYGRLSALVDDAHHQLGLPIPTTIIVHGKEMHLAPGGGPADRRLPCMVATDNERSIYLSLKSGEVVGFDTRTRVMTKEEFEKAEKRYGPVDEIRPVEEIKSLRALARWHFTMARRIFLKDGYHSSIAFMVRDYQPIKHLEVPFEDRSAKYLLMRLVADEVERCNANAVMLVGEQWAAKANSKQPFLYPSEMPDRTEHLVLDVCAESGESFSLTAQILRKEDAIKLGDTIELDCEIMMIFEPIREVWRKLGTAKQ